MTTKEELEKQKVYYLSQNGQEKAKKNRLKAKEKRRKDIKPRICFLCNKEIEVLKCNSQKYHTDCSKEVWKEYRKNRYRKDGFKEWLEDYNKKRYVHRGFGKIKCIVCEKEFNKISRNNSICNGCKKARRKILNKKNKYKVREYIKKRKIECKEFLLSTRLRTYLRDALRIYTQKGKIYSSSKYGIDYQKIIEHLKPFPEDLSKYHIDHIKPLCSFDLTKPDEVKKAFAPKNHQWLLARENIIKGQQDKKLKFGGKKIYDI